MVAPPGAFGMVAARNKGKRAVEMDKTGQMHRLGRRGFLGSALAFGTLGVTAPAWGQSIDPTTGQQILGQSQGGAAPDLGTYQLDPNADSRRNISSFRGQDWRPYFPSLQHGAILVDVTSRALHYWSEDEATYRLFPSSIPITEELTRRGRTEIVRKAQSPIWTPTPSMRERNPSLPVQVKGGAPENPLGPYALYLTWPAYLIHGTHDTRKIGRKSSDGCYGLYNEHITELFGLAGVGTQVLIM